MTINCLIIDDEPASQEVVKIFIDKIGFLKTVGVCANAMEALAFLQQQNTIDLLFLDINMPSVSGLTFYKSLSKKPYVIFTTAYSEFALDGFEVNAIDYLLKPFSFDRFLTAVNKVVEKMTQKDNTSSHEFIFIKVDKKQHKIAINSIFYIEAYGDYVKIHLENSLLVTYSTFSTFLQTLSPSVFIQTHKSFAINLQKVTFIEGNRVVLNTFKVPVGATFKIKFLEKINLF